jgi:hypothetical protein
VDANLQSMNAREVEAIAADLRRSRRRIREAVAFAAGCTVIALGSAPVALGVAGAFAAGAATGALVAIVGRLSRLDRIAQLALDPVAHELPEVRRYANRFTSHFERERLADWIVEILRETASIPGNWYLTARVLRYADELAALGKDLTDPRVEIRPASAAAVHLLLTQAVDSPLYNPAVPGDRLPAIIANIRLGITRSSV